MYLVYPALLPSKVFFPPVPHVALVTHATQAGPTDHHLPAAPGTDPRNRRRDQPQEVSAVQQRPGPETFIAIILIQISQNTVNQLTTSQLSEEQGSTATAALSAERYRPKIYGFQVHEIAKWQRWQEAMRDK